MAKPTTKKTLCFRMSEYKEAHVVWIHRIVLIIDSLAWSFFYCTNGYSICRPMPLKSYLLGSQSNIKFTMEPVSLIVALCFIACIVIMQICIEIKKTRDRKKDADIALMAINARKSITNARLQLGHSTTSFDQVCLVNEIAS